MNPIIDCHAHIIPRSTLRKFGGIGPEIVRRRGVYYLRIETNEFIIPNLGIVDTETRSKDMDSMGIDVQIVSLPSPAFLYWIDPERSIKIAKAFNDGIAETIKKTDRLRGLATIPLQNPIEACKELKRATQDLGLVGVSIGTNINGMNLDNGELAPFFETAEDLDVSVMVHPWNVAGKDRMREYYLGNIIGNPSETSIAISSLIFGGVLERFHKIRLVFPHGGGFIPYQIGRLDKAFEIRPECASLIKSKPSVQAKRLYYDSILHNNKSLSFLVSSTGTKNIVLGSDYPFLIGEDKPVSAIAGNRFLTKSQKDAILSRNATKVYLTHILK